MEGITAESSHLENHFYDYMNTRPLFFFSVKPPLCRPERPARVLRVSRTSREAAQSL